MHRTVARAAGREGHPLLLLDDGRVAALRARLGTTHRFLWERP
jgi:hypothetical protein